MNSGDVHRILLSAAVAMISDARRDEADAGIRIKIAFSIDEEANEYGGFARCDWRRTLKRRWNERERG